jgi:hypothetical protein
MLFRQSRQSNSGFKGPEEGYFKEGHSYPHNCALLQAQDFEACPQTQVPEKQSTQEEHSGQAFHCQVPLDNRIEHEID